MLHGQSVAQLQHARATVLPAKPKARASCHKADMLDIVTLVSVTSMYVLDTKAMSSGLKFCIA